MDDHQPLSDTSRGSLLGSLLFSPRDRSPSPPREPRSSQQPQMQCKKGRRTFVQVEGGTGHSGGRVDCAAGSEDSVKEAFAQHRSAVQKILNESSQQALEAIMQHTQGLSVGAQSSCSPATGDPFDHGQQAGPSSEPQPEVFGVTANEDLRSLVFRKQQEHRQSVAMQRQSVARQSVARQSVARQSVAMTNVDSMLTSTPMEPELSECDKRHKDIAERVLEAHHYNATHPDDEIKLAKAVFADANDMKAQVRMAMDQHDYNVADFYWKTGYSQAIATSPTFENFTLFVIAFNALWIAIDVDNNDTNLLVDAHPVFQVADNLFCAFFVFEWAVRFCAFRRKKDCLKDAWFVFDTLLALLMALETWMLTVMIVFFSAGKGANSDAMGDTSLLKGFRLVRLVRMARVLRLLNALPELMVVIKGMFVATRAVSCTVMLMLLIIYVFAVLFRQLTDGTDLGERRFPSVTRSMRFLLLSGTIPDLADHTNEIWDQGVFYALVYLGFILIVSITVMNMLVGVLVGVVNTVASVEKEQLMVHFVKQNLLGVLEGKIKDPDGRYTRVDANNDGHICREEFDVLITMPQAIRSFDQMGVDVVGLVDLADFIFQDTDSLAFSDFMELIMQLRGSNQATVKDIVDLRKFILTEMKTLHADISAVEHDLSELDKGTKPKQSQHKPNVFGRALTTTFKPSRVFADADLPVRIPSRADVEADSPVREDSRPEEILHDDSKAETNGSPPDAPHSPKKTRKTKKTKRVDDKAAVEGDHEGAINGFTNGFTNGFAHDLCDDNETC